MRSGKLKAKNAVKDRKNTLRMRLPNKYRDTSRKVRKKELKKKINALRTNIS